jgi:hypothetical protein
VSCYLDNVAAPYGDSFDWTVTGALLASGETGKGPSIKVILPSPPAPVTFSVSVKDDDGYVGANTRVLKPIPFMQAAVERFFCKIRHLYMKFPPFFIDPGDPVRDLNVNPVTERELEGVLGLADQMANMARTALSLMESARHPVRIGRLPDSVSMDEPVEERHLWSDGAKIRKT